MSIDRRKVAATIERHRTNPRTCFPHRIIHAGAETMKATIQTSQRRDGESRAPGCFRTAFPLHRHGLDLDPARSWSGT